MTTDICWLELSILGPLLGACGLMWEGPTARARQLAIGISGMSLLCAVVFWGQIALGWRESPSESWVNTLSGYQIFSIDALNLPLIPLVAWIHCLKILVTVRVHTRRSVFSGLLASQAITIATMATMNPWLVILGLCAEMCWLLLRCEDRKPHSRLLLLTCTTIALCLVTGQILQGASSAGSWLKELGSVCLVIGVALRCGLVPGHLWVKPLFDHAPVGTAVLYIAPTMAPYALVRLVLPVASAELLSALSFLALTTAAYTSCLAIVQRDTRRLLAHLCLSQLALLVAGLLMTNLLGVTGALCVWVSACLSLTGFGLMVRAVEARCGRLWLDEYHGLASQIPALAACFLLTGLACVGFPGTFGFIGAELLVDGAVESSLATGLLMLFTKAINGVVIMQAFFRLFMGTRPVDSLPMGLRLRESMAIAGLMAVIVLAGLLPQSMVASRHEAAKIILHLREHGVSAVHEQATEHGARETKQPVFPSSYRRSVTHHDS